jgi:hypothetical protein
MSVSTPSREEIVQLAVEWCRQTAVVEPGGFARLLTDDCVTHGLAMFGRTTRGSQDVTALCQRIAEAYPNRECHVLDAVVEGDKVACRWTMTFPSGPLNWRTSSGVVEGMTVFVVRDHRIAELWTNFARWWV